MDFTKKVSGLESRLELLTLGGFQGLLRSPLAVPDPSSANFRTPLGPLLPDYTILHLRLPSFLDIAVNVLYTSDFANDLSLYFYVKI